MLTSAFATPLSLSTTSPFVQSTLLICHKPQRPLSVFSPRACALPPLTSEVVIKVDPTTGERTDSIDGIPLHLGNTKLDTGIIDPLPIETERSAEAYVIAPDNYNSVVVFAHGFSQRPRNYTTLLCALAASGKMILCPRVWVLDCLNPFYTVETMGLLTGLAAKLQTALLIDMLRCVALAKSFDKPYEMYGHSMGGAMSLTAAWWLRHRVNELRSVVCLAPAIGPTIETKLNPLININQPGGDQSLDDLVSEINAPVLLLHGSDDIIVRHQNTNAIYEAFRDAGEHFGWGEIDEGRHVGFQDRLNISVFNPLVNFKLWLFEVLLFKIVNAFVYGGSDDLSQDNRAQLEVTKIMLKEWLAGLDAGRGFTELKDAVQNAAASSGLLTWQWVGDKQKELVEATQPVVVGVDETEA